jgi:hypothetical protein
MPEARARSSQMAWQLRPFIRGERPIARRMWYVIAGLLVAWTFLVVFVALPGAVNPATYLAGAGGRGTFTPTGPHESCSYGAGYWTCIQGTDGYLTPGHVSTWFPGEIYGPIPVRMPIWNWGTGQHDAYYAGFMAVFDGLVFSCIDLGLVVAVVIVAYPGYRAWRSAKSSRAGGAPAAGAA